MQFKVGQEQPQLPGANFAQAIDGISQAIFSALSKDPFLGPFAKVLPPPPKVSAIFARQAGGGPAGLPQFPLLPPFPLLPQAAEVAKQLIETGTGTQHNPFA